VNTTSDLIVELIRAANNAERLGDLERHDLLQRVVINTRTMVNSVEHSDQKAVAQQIIGRQLKAATWAARAENLDEVKKALLSVASILQELRMLIVQHQDVQASSSSSC
jgi:hypothetical protein